MPALPDRYEVTLYFGVTVGTQLLIHEHTMRVNISEAGSPGVGFGSFEVLKKGGVAEDLESSMLTYLALIYPHYSTTTDFIKMELWTAEIGSDDFTFLSVMDIGEVGSGAGNQADRYLMWSYRCTDGSVMKQVYLEGENSFDTKQTYPTSSTDLNAIRVYTIGNDSPFLSFRGGVPISSEFLSGGQAESVWKARHR